MHLPLWRYHYITTCPAHVLDLIDSKQTSKWHANNCRLVFNWLHHGCNIFMMMSFIAPRFTCDHCVQSSLEQLERDPVFNPLCLDTNLYLHLRVRGLLTRSSQPAGTHGQGRGHRRDANRPPEGSTQRQVRVGGERDKM